MDNEPTEQTEPIDQAVKETSRSVLWLGVVGVVVVLVALLLMQWPVPQRTLVATTTSHINRLTLQLQEGGQFSGLIVDLLVYVALIGALVMMSAIWLRGTRRAAEVLILIGLFGLAYAGSMALYNGPMVSVCGFSMILMAGLVAWATMGHELGDLEGNAEMAMENQVRE